MTRPFISALVVTMVLTLLTMTQTVFASEAVQPFDYDIELNVPSAQHQLLADHLDLYRWRGSERMNETQLQRLIGLAPAQVRELLATEGYYSPTIKAASEYVDSRWIVNLDVNPGTPVRVSSVDIQVTGSFNDGSAVNRKRLEKMRTDWSMQTPAVFRHEDWESAKRSALKSLLLNGYPTASILESHAIVNQKTLLVELKVILDSGALFTFGKLEISGLQRYPASIIERLNPVKAGEIYSQIKLLEFQSRLHNSPYFASADVSMKIDGKQPADVPIKARVSENPSKKLGFGIGMSTDTGARGLIDYRDLNFFDRAWSLGSTLKLEEKRQSWVNEIQLPLSEQRFRDSFSGLAEHTDIEGEETQKLILGGKRTFIHDKVETSYGLRYFLENQYVADSTSASAAALSPSYSWTLRNVDNLLYPTRGYSINFQADTATRSILSDQDFIRGYTRGAFYYPLNESNQLYLRAELGIVAASTSDGIPSDLLFRTGGDQTIRGYAYQSLGVTEGTAVVGGRYLALGSVEYVHWLTPKWGTGVFIDGGNAADDPNMLIPVYGYGLGARWKSPVGPLNLDIAYGENVRATRIHFSLGFRF